jgi:hypothetical protein
LLKDNNEKYKDEVTWRNLHCKHGRIYWGGGVGRVKPPAQNLSNSPNKVFNPIKISLHPFYFVWEALTQTPNSCRSSLSGATCTPLEIFLPLLLNTVNRNKWKSALDCKWLNCSLQRSNKGHRNFIIPVVLMWR